MEAITQHCHPPPTPYLTPTPIPPDPVHSLHILSLGTHNTDSLCVVQAFLVDGGDHTALSTVRSVEFVGNRTECALLLMLRGWGHDYKGIRDSHRGSIRKVYTFSSATKMASVLLQMSEDSYRLYVKVRNVYSDSHSKNITVFIILMIYS